MRTLGVDISHWEGDIDWELAYPVDAIRLHEGNRGAVFD